MNILDLATKDYRRKISGPPLSIEIPEWKDKETGEIPVIYYRASMNAIDAGTVLAAFDSGNQALAVVTTVIVRSLKKDGSKAFKMAERPEIEREVDNNVLNRIVIEMNSQKESVEEIKKN